jgi:shikimate dehydrogenase
MSLSGAAKLAGIVGWPVTQSLSPRLHSYWLNELAVDGAYVPLAVRPEDFSTVVVGLQKAGFAGVNVTVPHKEAAFALCHDLDRAALAARAVNLLTFHGDGRMEGRNTDASGLAASLRDELGAKALTGKAAVILGAGGAARAAVVALQELGASDIRIVNRSRGRADRLAADFGPKSNIIVFDAQDWARAARDVALIVHATSAGMKSTPSLEISLDPLPKTAVICDIVYNPLETPLLARAKKARFKTIDGLGMLLHQAVPAFNAFFGREPKVTPGLRKALQEALGSGK